MPEYLAPGVYVEEVPSAIKTIAGASTSTAGMVGMTERGPTNRTVLITSPAEMSRTFGGHLNPALFGGNDFLSYAADGFFGNGGARAYIVRIVGDDAVQSTLGLVAEDGTVTARPVLAATARAGQPSLLLDDRGDLSSGHRVLLADGTASEEVVIAGDDFPDHLGLGASLSGPHPADTPVTGHATTAIAAVLTADVAPGTAVLALDDASGLAADDVLLLDSGPGGLELATIASIATNDVTLTSGLNLEHLAASTSLATVADGPATTLDADASEGDDGLLVASSAGFDASDIVTVGDGSGSDEVLTLVAAVDAVAGRLEVGGGLELDHPRWSTATLQDTAAITGSLVGEVEAGDLVLTVDDATGLTPADVLLITGGPDGTDELVTIAAITPTLTGDHDIELEDPVAGSHAADSVLLGLGDGSRTTTLVAEAGPSAGAVLLEAPIAGFDGGDVIRLHHPAGTNEHAIVTAVPDLVSIEEPLAADHAAGIQATASVGVLTVNARWPGGWGDSLRVTVGSDPIVETEVTAFAAVGSTTVELATAIGLYPGSVIVFANGVTSEVADVDTGDGVVSLVEPLPAEVTETTTVASREFSITVERVEDGKTAESEVFGQLSLSPDHPRHAPKIVGSWDASTGRPSESGESQLVRLTDESTAATRALPMITGVRRALDGGDDDIAGVTEDTYVGTAAVDPDLRTGIQALENESSISIVAVPGQTSLTVQHALVGHCEKMRYRFAVLDVPIGSSIDQARSHRQNFNSTRAAVNYPGLVIADRFGQRGDRRVIPPSGHVLGIYARTDQQRGVHKAPANEDVRGILALEKALTKGEQDILNPNHVNCFRDFRSENAGLKLFGARVATSDPEWRYVNVRRLLLFIEQSIDIGSRWAVFEPNAEPLWDTMRQSITAFLTTVWRSGALEGTKVEEAFFVNIGYGETMTQADIDNGRLIAEVGVAPVKPAEFVIVRIMQTTREALAG